MALTKTEQELLIQIAKKPAVLKTASSASLKKKEFIAEAVAANPKAIKYAAEEILTDHEFLKKLAAANGMVAAHIPLKYNSAAVFHAAIGNTLDVVPYIPKKIYRDIANGTGIIQEEPYVVCDGLSYANEHDINRLLTTKNHAIFLAKHFRLGFKQGVAKKYNADKDVALAAVGTSAFNFYYLDKSLQNDMDIIKCAYRNDPSMFVEKKTTCPILKSPFPVNLLAPHRDAVVKDREFIKDCLLSGDVYILEPEYGDDEEIALLATKSCCSRTSGIRYDIPENNYALLSDRLKHNDEIIRMYLARNGQSLDYMPDDVCDNAEYVKLALESSTYAANYMSDRLMSDKSFVLEILANRDGKGFFDILGAIDPELLSDDDVFELTLSKELTSLSVMWFPNVHFDKESRDFLVRLVEAVTENPKHPNNQDMLRCVPIIYRNDEWIVTTCVANNPAMFYFAGEELRNNAEFALSLMMTYDIDLSQWLSDEVKYNKEVAAYLKKKELQQKLF